MAPNFFTAVAICITIVVVGAVNAQTNSTTNSSMVIGSSTEPSRFRPFAVDTNRSLSGYQQKQLQNISRELHSPGFLYDNYFTDYVYNSNYPPPLSSDGKPTTIEVSLKSISLRGFNESCADMVIPCLQARMRATLVLQWKDPRFEFTVPSGYKNDYIKSGGGSYNGVRPWSPSVKMGENGLGFNFFSDTVTLIRKDGTVHMEMKTAITMESRNAPDKDGETIYSFQIKEGVSPIDVVLLEWSKVPLSSAYATAFSRPDEAGVRKAFKLDYSVGKGQCKSFIEYGDIGNMTTSCLEGFLKMTPTTMA